METNSTSTKTQLETFIAKCVMSNTRLQSMRPGVGQLTIQEFIHQTDADGKRAYGRMVEEFTSKNGKSRYAKKGSSSKPMFGGIDAYELMDAIDILIEMEEVAKEKEKCQTKAAGIRSRLNDLKTPDELRAELKAELATLETA